MPNIDTEPIGLDEAKQVLALSSALHDHDEDIERMVMAVRQEAEKLIGSPIIETTKNQYLDRWPTGESDMDWWDGVRDGALESLNAGTEVQLLSGYIQEVTEVAIYDESDTRQVIPATVYLADLDRNRLVLRTGQSWPTSYGTVLSLRRAKGIEIVLKMGWADRASTPEDLRERLKERLLQRWRARSTDPAQWAAKGLSSPREEAVSAWFYGHYTNLKFGRDNL